MLIYIEDGGIESNPSEVSEYRSNMGDNLFVEDEILRNILIELSLKLNPDFFFDNKSEKFDISFERKKMILEENKNL